MFQNKIQQIIRNPFSTKRSSFSEQVKKPTSVIELLKQRKSEKGKAEIIDPLSDIQPEPQNKVHYVPRLGDGKIQENQIKISFWNINGLYSVLKSKALVTYLKESQPDILCLNETKVTKESLDTKPGYTSWIPDSYSSFFHCCRMKKGIYGSAIISKYQPKHVKYGFGIEKYDKEGRVVMVEFQHFYLVCCYAPLSSRNNERFKLRNVEFDPHLRQYLKHLRSKKHVILCGDLNLIHTENDIYDINAMYSHPDHYQQERINFQRLLNEGFCDTYRKLYPEGKQYTSFSNLFNRRLDNKGLRLDYFVVDDKAMPYVSDSKILDQVKGSDHVPIELIINPNFGIVTNEG